VEAELIVKRRPLCWPSGSAPVFSPSKDGQGIAFADLLFPSPAFVDVLQSQVAILNPLVAAMIR
jgi:hypothetical protein